jgi:hypothetical protein
MATTKELTYSEQIATLAWKVMSGEAMKHQNITGFAQHFAAAGQWATMCQAIVDGLESLSGENTWRPSSATEAEAIGIAEVDGEEVYWWYNGAETDWSATSPEWWEETLEQYGVVSE